MQYITTVAELETMVTTMDTSCISVDTETTGLDPYTSQLLLVQIYDGTHVYVIDFTKIPIRALHLLKPVLEDTNIRKIGHNLVFDWKVFYHFARIEMICMHDSMITERMLFAGLRLKHTLKDIVFRRLQIELDKSIRESFIGLDVSEEQQFTQEQLAYAAQDTIYLHQIYAQQMQEVQEKELERIYQLEMNIIAATALMEYTGITVNESMLRDMVPSFERFVDRADKALQDMFLAQGIVTELVFTRYGYTALNSSSTAQVKEALAAIGIRIISKGKLSLDAKAVQRWDMLHRKKYKDWGIDYHSLIDDEEVADALEDYTILENPFLRAFAFLQGARKLLSTYVLGLIQAINPVTKRVHPHFNSYGAEATGRYSSNGPNFQNLPNDKKLALLGLSYSLRKAIEASPGRKLIIADYSGIELVILAANSGDESLMSMILRGDVHTAVAQQVLGYTDITVENKKQPPHKLWREAAKTLSYGIAYGTTGRNLSETLNVMLAAVGYKIDAQQGDELIAKWFALFPKTHAYLMSNAERAITQGYVTDAWGRRRQWDLTTLDKWKKLAAMREGMNAPIQSTSATMTKRAIDLLWTRLDKRKARIVITVHDEVVVESIESYADECTTIVKACMEQAIQETLPVIAHEVGRYEGTSVSPNQSYRYDK